MKPSAGIKAAKRWPRRRFWAISRAALLLGILGGAYTWKHQSPPLKALLPADTGRPQRVVCVRGRDDAAFSGPPGRTSCAG